MITVYQINGQTVTPLADARLYEFLSGGMVGVVLGCEITSLGANQIKVGAGWILIQGRVIEIQEETILVNTSSSGQVDGRLLLQIDVSNDDTPGTWVSQAQTPLPALTQEDINGSGTIYQLPMATYQVDQLQVTNLQTAFSVAPSPVSFKYAATYTLEGWTGGGPYTQTATLVPLDGGPAVTASSKFDGPFMTQQVNDADTRKALLEVLGQINNSYTTLGDGTMTVSGVEDQPQAEIEVVVKIKQGGS